MKTLHITQRPKEEDPIVQLTADVFAGSIRRPMGLQVKTTPPLTKPKGQQR